MRVELVQAPTHQDMGRRNCCACGLLFEQGPALARLLNDDAIPLDVGVVCPRCLEEGAEHIERRMESRARWARIEADEYEQLAEESVEDMPTPDEYQAFTQLFGGPRFASVRAAAESQGEEYWGTD